MNPHRAGTAHPMGEPTASLRLQSAILIGRGAMNELRAILDELAGGRADDDSAVLATVVRVLGSAYRGVGARRLVARDGEAIGLVSGGCLEADVARQAWRLPEGGAAAVIRYDSSGPGGDWAFSLGCQGTVDILVERLDGADAPPWVDFLRGRLDRHEPSVLARVLRVEPGEARARVGSFLALGLDGAIVHDLGTPGLVGSVAAAARNALDPGRSGHTVLDGVAIVLEVVEPPPTLIVCGAGPDALPVVRLAAELGWHVAVVDGRHRPATRQRFVAAAEVLTLAELDRMRVLAARPRAAAVVMTHNVAEDEAFLGPLLASPAAYVGLLGPRHRAERLLGGLGPLAAAARGRLHAPVGLDLGAETPAEIALAILAEIQATFAGRDGGSLRGRDRPIHDRPVFQPTGAVAASG